MQLKHHPTYAACVAQVPAGQRVRRGVGPRLRQDHQGALVLVLGGGHLLKWVELECQKGTMVVVVCDYDGYDCC